MRVAAPTFPVITIVFFAFALGSCEKPEMRSSDSLAEADSGKPRESFSFPIKRLLTNSEGTKIDATVIGRNSTHVMIIRLVDQKQFSFPITKLSTEDQKWVSSLPHHHVSISGTKPQKTESRTTSLVEKRLEVLEEEIKGVRNDMRNYEFGSIKQRSLQSQLERLERERAESLSELRDLQSR